MSTVLSSRMKSPSLDAPKVLIADDDEATRILLRMALTQWGYQVVEARDGEEAWKILLQPDPPQILTLDWLMPRLDGISLCKRIDKELTFHPYIIFLTRMSGTENVIQGLEAGADEFIFKPFDLPELRIRVFAGERIIKYRNQLTEKNQQLQEYFAKIKEITDGQKKPQIPAADLLVLLNEINNNLRDVNDALGNDKDKNENSIKKIQLAQNKVNNIIDVLKELSPESRTKQASTSNAKPAVAIAAPPFVPPVSQVTQQQPAPIAAKPAPLPPVTTSEAHHGSMINMPRMREFFGNDLSAIQEFIRTFVSLSTDQVNQIETAINAKDDKSAKYLFHLLGSASGNSGMTKIYDVCGTGEDKATKLDWKAAAECHRKLKTMLIQLQIELANGLKK